MFVIVRSFWHPRGMEHEEIEDLPDHAGQRVSGGSASAQSGVERVAVCHEHARLHLSLRPH